MFCFDWLGALLGLGHLLELFVNLASVFAGLGELVGLGEGLADAGLGVGESAVCSFGAVVGGGLVSSAHQSSPNSGSPTPIQARRQLIAVLLC